MPLNYDVNLSDSHCRPHSHWDLYRYLVQYGVIHTSETRTSGAFTVTRTSTNTCNSVAIKYLV